jgi:DNA-binding transcriptional LysR family regulator
MPIRHARGCQAGSAMLEPRDLEALIAVADHGGISAAARALHCTQPALTRRVQRLERTVGTALLERHASGSRLLPAGARLVARARPPLDALTTLDAAPGRGATIGVLPSVEAWLLPLLFERLPRGTADALTPVDLGPRDGLQAVAEGRADAALVSDWLPERVPEGVTVLDLLLEPYVLLCPPGHRLLRQRVVSARALRAEHVVSAPHPDCGGRLAETGSSQRMASSIAHAHALVASRSGVALWPACTTVAPGALPRVITERTAARRLGLAADTRALASPALRPVVDAIVDATRHRPGSRGQWLCH